MDRPIRELPKRAHTFSRSAPAAASPRIDAQVELHNNKNRTFAFILWFLQPFALVSVGARGILVRSVFEVSFRAGLSLLLPS